MANRQQYTLEEIKTAIDGTYGIVSQLAKKLDVSNVTVYNYIKAWPEIRDCLTQERERTKDYVEIEFIRLIKEGNTKAILQAAKTLLKDRGYGYVSEQTATQSTSPNYLLNILSEKIEQGGDE
jgi:undecaprenyl pyrophosphate synthase